MPDSQAVLQLLSGTYIDGKRLNHLADLAPGAAVHNQRTFSFVTAFGLDSICKIKN